MNGPPSPRLRAGGLLCGRPASRSALRAKAGAGEGNRTLVISLEDWYKGLNSAKVGGKRTCVNPRIVLEI
jgi:hypothetical protein